MAKEVPLRGLFRRNEELPEPPPPPAPPQRPREVFPGPPTRPAPQPPHTTKINFYSVPLPEQSQDTGYTSSQDGRAREQQDDEAAPRSILRRGAKEGDQEFVASEEFLEGNWAEAEGEEGSHVHVIPIKDGPEPKGPTTDTGLIKYRLPNSWTSQFTRARAEGQKTEAATQVFWASQLDQVQNYLLGEQAQGVVEASRLKGAARTLEEMALREAQSQALSCVQKTDRRLSNAEDHIRHLTELRVMQSVTIAKLEEKLRSESSLRSTLTQELRMAERWRREAEAQRDDDAHAAADATAKAASLAQLNTLLLKALKIRDPSSVLLSAAGPEHGTDGETLEAVSDATTLPLVEEAAPQMSPHPEEPSSDRRHYGTSPRVRGQRPYHDEAISPHPPVPQQARAQTLPRKITDPTQETWRGRGDTVSSDRSTGSRGQRRSDREGGGQSPALRAGRRSASQGHLAAEANFIDLPAQELTEEQYVLAIRREESAQAQRRPSVQSQASAGSQQRGSPRQSTMGRSSRHGSAQSLRQPTATLHQIDGHTLPRRHHSSDSRRKGSAQSYRLQGEMSETTSDRPDSPPIVPKRPVESHLRTPIHVSTYQERQKSIDSPRKAHKVPQTVQIQEIREEDESSDQDSQLSSPKQRGHQRPPSHDQAFRQPPPPRQRKSPPSSGAELRGGPAKRQEGRPTKGSGRPRESGAEWQPPAPVHRQPPSPNHQQHSAEIHEEPPPQAYAVFHARAAPSDSDLGRQGPRRQDLTVQGPSDLPHPPRQQGQAVHGYSKHNEQDHSVRQSQGSFRRYGQPGTSRQPAEGPLEDQEAEARTREEAGTQVNTLLSGDLASLTSRSPSIASTLRVKL